VRAVAGIVLALALASPAAAATVARTTPEAGPVLAGPEVLWGSQGLDGSVRVMAGAPGRPPRLVHRVAAPAGEETTRGIGPLAASAEAFAVRVPTSTLADSGSDWRSYVGVDALLAGLRSGGVSVLFGSLPERVGDGTCDGEYHALEGFDVDGARVAVASESGPCVLTEPGQARFSIAVHEGGARRVVDPGRGARPLDVRLAGRFLAWVQGGRALVVHDLEAGAAVARVRARDLGARTIGGFDLQADGAVAFGYWRPQWRGSRLGALLPGRPGVRLLDRHVSEKLALAGGRVLYERTRDHVFRRTSLVLRPLAGGSRRTLARFGARRDMAGPVDLDATRATWAVDRGARRPGRIVVREL
jgi:hypothetical protein